MSNSSVEADYKEITEIKINTATSTEEILANIKYNLVKYKFNSITNLIAWRKLKKVAVVGGGPTLKTTKNLLKRSNYDFIIVCGSAHDYLVNNKIIPDFCVVCDPDPLVNKYMKEASIVYPIKYLIASQCSPKTFEFIQNKGIRPHIWNAAANDRNEEIFGPGQLAIGGGCTVGTRAIVIAHCFGYDNIDLFGFDTCISEVGESHAYGFHDEEKEKITKVLDITVGNVKFKMAEYHLGQLMDFKALLASSLKNVNFTVHGDGAIKTLFEMGRKGI